MAYGIKFRPNKPGSPHLNGKVERSQKTDLAGFYSITDLSDFDKLQDELSQWQFYYNWYRPHGSLNNKTPCDITHDLADKTPLWEDIERNYHPNNEHIQDPNYRLEMELRELKGSL